MTEYTLSVVQLCPDAYRDQANAVAAAYGYGPGNLSVELRHTDGSTWWGCHAWWIPEVLAEALNPPDEVPVTAEILAHVVTSAQETDDAHAHWLEVLAANGLTVVEPAE